MNHFGAMMMDMVGWLWQSRLNEILNSTLHPHDENLIKLWQGKKRPVRDTRANEYPKLKASSK